MRLRRQIQHRSEPNWHLRDCSIHPSSDSSVRLDELCWIKPATRVLAITGTDERSNEFAHFKMKMGEVTTVGGSDRRNLLTAFHRLARMHQHVLNVSVIRLHIFPFSVFEIGVKYDDNVSPAGAAIARKQN